MAHALGQILRVNLLSGKIIREVVPDNVRRDYVGGRGLGIYYLYQELRPHIEPLGEENKLILVNGVLAGTNAQGVARWLAMTKSPLTGGIGRSSCGGNFGAVMKFAGLDGIIIEGTAEKPVYLYVNESEAVIKDAEDLWGLDTQSTQTVLKSRYQENIEVACIGPAGENLVRYAAIVNGTRTAARCGVGTVMGSKNLKAIAVSGKGPVSLAAPKVFKELVTKQIDILKDHPRRQSMSKAGTTTITTHVNILGVYPVKNFQEGQQEQWENLGTEAFQKVKVKNTGCYSCMTRCGQIYSVEEGPYRGAQSEGPEYESIWSFGGMIGNTELGATVQADALCDRLGLDTISTGGVIAFAFELFERGMLTEYDTGGLELNWGNHRALLALIEQIGYRRGLGAILAEGTKRAAARFQQGANYYAMQVKGLEFGGYDPRGIKGYALSYATSNIGASHMYGRPREELYGQVDRFSETGKGPLIASAQAHLAYEEIASICCFGNSGMTDEHLNSLMAAATGLKEFAQVGERILCLERMFNIREGFSRVDDQLPERFKLEPLANAGPSTGQKVENLEGLLDEYYDSLGYRRDGVPASDRLKALGLEWAIPAGGEGNEVDK